MSVHPPMQVNRVWCCSATSVLMPPTALSDAADVQSIDASLQHAYMLSGELINWFKSRGRTKRHLRLSSNACQYDQ